MILYLDTTGNDVTEVVLVSEKKSVRKQYARSRAEDLSQILKSFLSRQKSSLGDLERIVVRQAAGFSSRIRSGIITANTLGYALDIPVSETSGTIPMDYASLIKLPSKKSLVPLYDREPNITLSNKKR